MDHLSRPRRHDRRAQNSAAESVSGDRSRARDQLDETLRGAVGDRPVHLIERQLRDSTAVCRGFGLDHPDTGHFGCCEGRQRHPVSPESPAQPFAEGIAGGKAAHLIGGMREQQLPGHIAHSKDAANARFETVVRLDEAAIIQFHPELLQGHAGRIGHPARRNQKPFHLMRAIRRDKSYRTPVSLRVSDRFHTFNADAQANIDAG